jgi:tripartite-type tricarboxylate transporter receptor subunit TctC
LTNFILILILIVLSFTSGANGAEKFPRNPIKLVVTHAAGTSNDIETRTVAPFLQKYLGVPIVIENMPGTGGRKSREFVFKEKPDGYHILGCTSSPLVRIPQFRSVPYKLEDFVPIMHFGAPHFRARGQGGLSLEDDPGLHKVC